MTNISIINSSELKKEAEIILFSSIIQQSPRLQKLLGFILKSPIEGNTITHKENTMGVYPLGETPDFDPEIDPIVRIQMYHLRKAIEYYHTSEGSNRPLIISFPKGAYIRELIIKKCSGRNRAGVARIKAFKEKHFGCCASFYQW